MIENQYIVSHTYRNCEKLKQKSFCLPFILSPIHFLFLLLHRVIILIFLFLKISTLKCLSLKNVESIEQLCCYSDWISPCDNAFWHLKALVYMDSSIFKTIAYFYSRKNNCFVLYFAFGNCTDIIFNASQLLFTTKRF